MANKSGIHINPNNKGKFTKKAKASGMSVQAFASHVKAHPEHYSGKTRQQANFAKVAKTKFKHQAGGLPGLAQTSSNAGSPADMFPTIDANYDPLDQIGPHAETEQQTGFLHNTQAGHKMMARYNANGYSQAVDPTTGQLSFTKGKNPELPVGVKDFNLAATAVTGVADAVGESKLRRDEYLTELKSMTPKFMTNPNASGLNNIPAYHMLGGEDRNMPQMMLGGSPDWLMYGGPEDNTNWSNIGKDFLDEGIAHKDSIYGKPSLYKVGGTVSADKAKEILRDGTVHGQPLTDKQKRYFGWIAGGSKMYGGYQTGGPVPQTSPPATPTPQPQQSGVENAANPDDYYKANATLSYYKDKLNASLKAKNTAGFTSFFSGLQGARKTGKPEDANTYIQNSQYNDYLSPEEVKKTLGSDKDYQNYLNSLKAVNTYNVSQGRQPLWGTQEGQNDPSKLNYGRRFASLQVTPSMAVTDVNQSTGAQRKYGREYKYNPATGQVEISETGDVGIRPAGYSAPPAAPAQQQQQQVASTPGTASRKYGGKGGKKYMVGGSVRFQAGGFNVGDEVDLTPAQIAELKKQGYKIKTV